MPDTTNRPTPERTAAYLELKNSGLELELGLLANAALHKDRAETEAYIWTLAQRHRDTDLGEALLAVVQGERTPTGYMIRRGGYQAGPFNTPEDAARYRRSGDELVAINKHGNVIDYAPQFGEDES